MRKALKLLSIIFILGILTVFWYYSTLSNRHKAIIKTQVYHRLGLVDNSWNVHLKDTSISLITPTLIIDNIYRSMEGPKVTRSFQIQHSNRRRPVADILLQALR